MTDRDNRPEQTAPLPNSEQALRQRAEELIREKAARTPGTLEALSPEEVRRALHDLRVHQIEMQTFRSMLFTIRDDTVREHLEIDQASHCGLIINELVINSMEYAFRESKADQQNEKK